MVRLASGRLGNSSSQFDVRKLIANLDDSSMGRDNPNVQASAPKSTGTAAIVSNVSIKMGREVLGPVQVMVDVGAERTVIPVALLDRFGVPPSGQVKASGFDGRAGDYFYYWVEIFVPDLRPRFLPVIGAPCRYILLGRDALMGARFEFDGANGTYTIYEPNVIGRLLHRFRYRLLRLRDYLSGR